MKQIEVVAAIITDNDKILATRRGYGEFVNMWEFPGGKIEPGETREVALRREIMEELEVDISINEYYLTVEYDYPDFHLTMHSYLCSMIGGVLHLNDHNDAKWVTRLDFDGMDWLPADVEILEALKLKL